MPFSSACFISIAFTAPIVERAARWTGPQRRIVEQQLNRLIADVTSDVAGGTLSRNGYHCKAPDCHLAASTQLEQSNITLVVFSVVFADDDNCYDRDVFTLHDEKSLRAVYSITVEPGGVTIERVFDATDPRMYFESLGAADADRETDCVGREPTAGRGGRRAPPPTLAMIGAPPVPDEQRVILSMASDACETTSVSVYSRNEKQIKKDCSGSIVDMPWIDGSADDDTSALMDRLVVAAGSDLSELQSPAPFSGQMTPANATGFAENCSWAVDPSSSGGVRFKIEFRCNDRSAQSPAIVFMGGRRRDENGEDDHRIRGEIHRLS